MRPQIGFRKDNRAQDLPQSDAGSAEHLPNDSCKTDGGLAVVVDAWPDLPEAIKAGILELVKAVLPMLSAGRSSPTWF
jgi:hypothetical protein